MAGANVLYVQHVVLAGRRWVLVIGAMTVGDVTQVCRSVRSRVLAQQQQQPPRITSSPDAGRVGEVIGLRARGARRGGGLTYGWC